MKLLVSLLNEVTDDPFPVESDSHEDFVLGTPAQTFKVLVTLNGISSIVWPEGFTHVRVSGKVDDELDMYSKYIRRESIAAPDEDTDVQVILDSLREGGVSYSERHRPSFSEAVVHHHTDPTSWTSQAGRVDIQVQAVKLVHWEASGRTVMARPRESKMAVVNRGDECKPFQSPGLRVVPGVSVCHSTGTPNVKLEDGQQAVGGGAKVRESDIVTPLPAQHYVNTSVSLAPPYKVKYDSAGHVFLRRVRTQTSLAAGHHFAGQQRKRPRGSAKQNKPSKKGYREVLVLDSDTDPSDHDVIDV